MKEVIILGKGPSHSQCFYDKEVWAVNDSYEFAKRIDKLFLTDTWEAFDLGWMKEAQARLKFEIVAPTPYPGLVVTPYPIEAVLLRFPTSFFTNTICYMIAYALLRGYRRIWLYGVDMLTHTSYIMEKGGVEYWMGVALGMGADVRNTPESATGRTFNGKLYGCWGEKQGIIQQILSGYISGNNTQEVDSNARLVPVL